MVVTTPKLGLPKGQGNDNARDYLKGAISGGGLWRALEILDNAILSTGSITLDNATLNNPTIVGWTNAQHNHSSAATAGSTLGPATTLATPTLQTPAVSGVMTFGGDATIQRTSAGALRVDTNLGVGVAPAAWASGFNPVQVGQAGALWGETANAYTRLSANTYYNAGFKAIVAGPAVNVDLTGTGTLNVSTAPSVAAGAAQTFTTRAQIASTGTLTLTPDAGQDAIQVTAGDAGLRHTTGALTLRAATYLFANAPAGYGLYPSTDNSLYLGGASNRWQAVYAAAGTINTSSREAKQDITPLDPAAALAAVLNTDPVVFDYKPPERTAEWYALPDDPEQAEAVLYQRLTSSPLEEAARHQAGFVLQDATGQYQTDPLFETGEGQSNAANSVGVILAALHAIDARLNALEGA